MQLIEPVYGLIIWSIFTVCLLILWVLAIVSILKSDFKDSRTKLTWMLLVIFLPVIGSVLYFLMGRNQRILKINR